MKILVDTCIWSLAFRRMTDSFVKEAQILKSLILEKKIQMIGPIRQELLSGIKSEKQFNSLKSHLSAFPDLPITTQDYELAAAFFNICRENGIQGSNTDFLICALSHHYQMPVFTNDADFLQYVRHCPVTLYVV